MIKNDYKPTEPKQPKQPSNGEAILNVLIAIAFVGFMLAIFR